METIEILSGDVLDINNAFDTYTEYKAAVDEELQRSAESFVRIGYLLKVARDTDILAESGYANMNEFAEKEYGLDKSQVSRFIRINDEFSENGYSDRLQENYKAFGYAKLALMLTLPAAVNEELTADYTKAEISAIREEIVEEEKISDIEVLMEEKDKRQQSFSSFGKMMYEIGRNTETYLGLYEAVADRVNDDRINLVIDNIMDVLAPAGEATIIRRIAGEGKKMFIIKSPETDLSLVDIRSGEKQTCTWEQLIEEIKTLCDSGEDGKEAWEFIYGMPFPEKAVAPVQQQKEKANKESRVKTVKKPENTIVGAEPKTNKEDEEKQKAEGEENEVAPVQQEKQIEEQMNITEFPEYMPESYVNNIERSPAGSSTAAEEQDGAEPGLLIGREGLELHIKNQSELINRDLFTMIKQCESRDWWGLARNAQGIIERAEGIQRMEGVYENE